VIRRDSPTFTTLPGLEQSTHRFLLALSFAGWGADSTRRAPVALKAGTALMSSGEAATHVMLRCS